MQIAKDVMKEILIFLVMIQVSYFLIPRALKSLLKGTMRALYNGSRGITRYSKKRVRRYLRQREKAAIMQQHKQPLNNNVITVKYPNGKVRRYNSR